MRVVDWTPMADVIPEGKQGNAEIKHFTVSEEDSERTKTRAMFDRHAFVPPGRYCQLLINGGAMMSDTLMEKYSNATAVRRATGDVFIAGLGLGMITLPIVQKEAVRTVLVIEKSSDVLALVEAPLRKAMGTDESKLTIIHGDALEWRPPKGQKWDCIYFDIWRDICGDNAPEITKFKRRFARRRNEGGWMGAWMEYEVREANREANRRFGSYF